MWIFLEIFRDFLFYLWGLFRIIWEFFTSRFGLCIKHNVCKSFGIDFYTNRNMQHFSFRIDLAPRPTLKKPNITVLEVTSRSITIKCTRQTSRDDAQKRFDIQMVVELRSEGTILRVNTSSLENKFVDLSAYKEYTFEAYEEWSGEKGPLNNVSVTTRPEG